MGNLDSIGLLYVANDIKLQCIIVNNDISIATQKRFDMQDWLIDNIGWSNHLDFIPRIDYFHNKVDIDLTNKWAIETFISYRVYWIENDEKRLEFILIWQ